MLLGEWWRGRGKGGLHDRDNLFRVDDWGATVFPSEKIEVGRQGIIEVSQNLREIIPYSVRPRCLLWKPV